MGGRRAAFVEGTLAAQVEGPPPGGPEQTDMIERGHNNAPCLGCEQRHPGCHSECPLYLEFAQERKAILAAAEKNRETTAYIIDQQNKTFRRLHRQRRK